MKFTQTPKGGCRPRCRHYLMGPAQAIFAVMLLIGAALALPRFALAQAPLLAADPIVGQPARPVVQGAAHLEGHYSDTSMLRLAIALKPPKLEEERQFLAQLQDKKSPLFHHYLSAAAWNARFSPAAADEQAVVDWLQSAGLTVTQRYPNRLLVDVEAPVTTIERALGIQINSYTAGNTAFFSNDRAPSLRPDLVNIVWAVLGLNSLEQERPASHRTVPVRPAYLPGPPKATGPAQHADASLSLRDAMNAKGGAVRTGIGKDGFGPQITAGAYDPTDIYSSQAYDYGALYNQGHCCNPLGNPGQSPPETSIAIATYGAQDLSDIAGFHATYPYLAYNVQLFNINGTPAPGDAEGTMDAEWATATSNSFGGYGNTSKVYVYQGANYQNNTITDVYNSILTDGYARVFSTSWACAEQQAVPGLTNSDCYAGTMNARDAIFMSMVGQGWTLVAASGDEGATATWCGAADGVFYPATDPFVVAAGGTTLSLDSYSNYLGESGWTGGIYGCDSNDGGSTGGFSSYWATPSYQSSFGYPSRATPDIALNADWLNSPQNYYFEGALSGNGGTSIVAPELAGFFAQANAYLLSLGNVCGSGSSACAPLGDAHSYLYDAGQFFAPHKPFYDITSGCNNNDITAEYGLGYYCAGSGFDQVTGWGSANMLQLSWAINWYSAAAAAAPTVNFTGPAVNTWYSTDQFINWSVIDVSGSVPGTGIAGFTQGWDSIPADPTSEATPGAGNSFYSGPQFPNATTGYLDFAGSGVSQGCHTVHVQAWNNMGRTSGDTTYGPVCYDTVPPATVLALSGTKQGIYYSSAVKVTLTATDAGSGVASTVYSLDGAAKVAYSGPLTVSAVGAHTLSYHSTDVAGNVESTHSASFSIAAKTDTKLTSSANPSVYGASVSLEASVIPSFGAAATGTVTFQLGTETLGTATLSGGKASFKTKTLPVGADSVTAVYGGSSTDIASTSAPLTQTVKQASTTTTLASSLNPATHGTSVTFTATISPQVAGEVTGKVLFKDGSTTLGSSTVKSSDDEATFTTSTLAVGTHAITAVYEGGASDSGSTSAVLKEVIH